MRLRADPRRLTARCCVCAVQFAPLTGIEVQSQRVEGSHLVVRVRLSVNLMAQTIEQVFSRRTKLLIDMCKAMHMEVPLFMALGIWAPSTKVPALGAARPNQRAAAAQASRMIMMRTDSEVDRNGGESQPET